MRWAVPKSIAGLRLDPLFCFPFLHDHHLWIQSAHFVNWHTYINRTRGYVMPLRHAENINQLWAAAIAEELIRLDITQFYISPGSRSTPLTIAAARNPRAQTVICYDERRAAFMALGFARATNKHAVLICTSGTAAANYYPAVIEAATEHLPLIVLSADRPPELRDTGANQTIDQQSLFGRYSAFFMDLPSPDAKISLRYLLSTVDQAVFQTSSPNAGVAHINCMFREPLAPNHENIGEAYLLSASDWLQSPKPFTHIEVGKPRPPKETIVTLNKTLRQNPMRLLIIGRLQNEDERRAAHNIAQKFNGPVFADITSGLRLDANLPGIIQYFDLLLLSASLKAHLAGAAILYVGGKYVSKRLLQFLSEHHGDQIHVHDNRTRLDPALSLNLRIECSLNALDEALLPLTKPSPLQSYLLTADKKAAEEIGRLQDDGDALDEIAVARAVSRLLSNTEALFLSSSMPIRDMDMYGLARPDGPRAVAANRGASGIDGIISTALGYSRGLKKPLTLIIGDLAFLHDLTALNMLRNHEFPLTIVLINNGGGGIFSFLPIAEYRELFEPFFATPHDLTFSDAARQFAVDYFPPKTRTVFESTFKQVHMEKKSCIIEVQTDRNDNIPLHKKLQQAIQNLFAGQ